MRDARPSNAGDRFQFALIMRQLVRLAGPRTSLYAVDIESVAAPDAAGVAGGSFEGIDYAEYYGVAVASSGDLGETWPDTAVTRTAARDTAVRHYEPALAVNGRGELAAAWLEGGGGFGGGAARSHCLSLHAAASADGGRTFSPPQRVARSCPDPAANGANSPAGGDYLGLVLPTNEFRLVWPGARAGAFQLWTRTLAVRPSRRG